MHIECGCASIPSNGTFFQNGDIKLAQISLWYLAFYVGDMFVYN